MSYGGASGSVVSGAGDEFWAAEVAWQSEQLDAELLVDLVDSRTEGPRFKTFVTYNLVSTLCPSGVRRRYSDFEWFRDLLKLRFHGIAIPALPEKRMLGTQTLEFVESRMKGLASFMRNVLANPYLRNDHTLRMFLTVEDSGAGEWEQAKKAAAAGEGSHPSSNIGLNRWFGVLRHLALPPDADAAAASLSLHLVDLEKALEAILASVSKYAELNTQLSGLLQEITSLAGSVEVTANAGAAAMAPAIGEAAEHSSAFAAIANKFGTAFSALGAVAKQSPTEVSLFLVDPIIKELARVSGLRELLAVRDLATKEYLAAFQKQEKLEFEQKQFALKGRQDKSALMEPQVAQAAQVVRLCREKLDDISKGLLQVEARKFGTVRNAKFTHILGQFGALGIASSTSARTLWSSYLTSMGLSEDDMTSAAQHTLDSTSSDDATLVRYVITPAPGITAVPAPPSSAVPLTTNPMVAGGRFPASAAALAAAAQEIDL